MWPLRREPDRTFVVIAQRFYGDAPDRPWQSITLNAWGFDDAIRRVQRHYGVRDHDWSLRTVEVHGIHEVTR